MVGGTQMPPSVSTGDREACSSPTGTVELRAPNVVCANGTVSRLLLEDLGERAGV